MDRNLSHYRRASTRREFFARAGSGLAGIALAHMLHEDGLLAASASAVDPLAPKPPHHPPTAKSIIWLFMEGGPSHVDLFDPKPKLKELQGQPIPESMRPKFTAMPGTSKNGLMPSKRTFKQYGQSGIWVSDWYPNVAQHVDDMTVIRSCWTDGINHLGGVTEMNSGSILSGRPCLGAWVNYGLGSANRNLPSFVVMLDDRDPIGGAKQWSAGFLPASYQGTQFRQGDTPLLHLKPPAGMTDSEQRNELALLKRLNEIWSEDKQEDSELDARIRSYELAYKMQSAAPEAVDLSKESEATKKLYGLDVEETRAFGTNCLLARRLVERGVRFVELYCGSGSGWDAHENVETNHSKWCKASDKPIAGLLTDLKARGMLKDTLVVWGGEFGRTPFNEKGLGRDHNPWGFTIWMAGGGVKGGQYIGSTDEIGMYATERRMHVNDIHATMLWALGLDHLRVTYMHNGRAERPTVVAGEVNKDVFA
ncbi:MAG TPA: DUF1501 domain-containing protein [Bryobacterales bacterium]|jgi:hypothetical protein|nr:DUF1501 domain-containing protein [Bryobacterales bacterium]